MGKLGAGGNALLISVVAAGAGGVGQALVVQRPQLAPVVVTVLLPSPRPRGLLLVLLAHLVLLLFTHGGDGGPTLAVHGGRGGGGDGAKEKKRGQRKVGTGGTQLVTLPKMVLPNAPCAAALPLSPPSIPLSLDLGS